VNLGEEFSRIHDCWNPRISGRLRMPLRDGHRDLGPGELFIVPRGVEHCPLALTDEAHVVLLKPKTALDTGNVVEARTVREEGRI
jgi:quercetin dioxygenase-like cupin family protein